MYFGYQESREERDARLQMEQRWDEAARDQEWFGRLFDLLIQARNSKDEAALQEAIDLVAVASCKSDDF